MGLLPSSHDLRCTKSAAMRQRVAAHGSRRHCEALARGRSVQLSARQVEMENAGGAAPPGTARGIEPLLLWPYHLPPAPSADHTQAPKAKSLKSFRKGLHVAGVTSNRSLDMTVDLPKPVSGTAAAWADLVEGMSKSWMWSAMAMQDIRMRYRGSLLGPFWLTISMVIMVAAMGMIYARLFHMEITHYLPFLTVGLVIWNFVSTVIIEGCQTFLSAQNIITQVRMPFSIHAWRTVYRNLIVLAHNAVIVPPVLIIFSVPVGWTVVFIVPALVILTINGIWISILLGMISARYRDVPPIVMSLVQVIFFVTPIFWPPDALGTWMQALALNPLFAAIDVMRAPLLGQSPLVYSWTVLLAATALGCVGTFVLFAKFRSRITYWI
jgi:ABC-2 type transport system permease protein/lipopolysaccharide transport system permease protein